MWKVCVGRLYIFNIEYDFRIEKLESSSVNCRVHNYIERIRDGFET